MTTPNHHLLEKLCRLAEQAGLETLRFYRTGTAATLKEDKSPLTDADRASHTLIVNALPQLLPGVRVISEESDDLADAVIDTTQPFWLVDPLDGTKEFLKGTGEFTVNIALLENGRPVLGVVHAPAIRLTYFATLEGGAFRQSGDAPATAIRTQPAPANAMRVVASKDHAGPLVQKLLSSLTNPELKSMGSSLKFCMVAAGEADVYLRDVPTMEWDTAAAQCVVEAAGGSLCTLDGEPLRYGKPGLKNGGIITVGDPKLNWKALL
ncbi:MAG: 3'(2'),5'-bisphosphate nucleotidase CysQ [Verrucomicrobia bacterium]|jgi:3'(2'), 5'-bisphosphate nucleotidase|nr:3'(2'),5'-bisphosphate nucleotidase CysQ [Verrucomicrobiota bacterium]